MKYNIVVTIKHRRVQCTPHGRRTIIHLRNNNKRITRYIIFFFFFILLLYCIQNNSSMSDTPRGQVIVYNIIRR